MLTCGVDYRANLSGRTIRAVGNGPSVRLTGILIACGIMSALQEGAPLEDCSMSLFTDPKNTFVSPAADLLRSRAIDLRGMHIW